MPRSLAAIDPATPLDDLERLAFGYQSWNYHPFFAGVNASALTSQTVYSMLVPGRIGQPITAVGLNVAVAAVGIAPTGFYVGLSDQKTMLAVSANLASLLIGSDTTLNLTSVGHKQFPLSLTQLTYQLPRTGFYYVHVLLNGTFGTTQPQFGRGGPAASAVALQGGNIGAGTNGTGQTSLTAGASVSVVSTSGLNFFAGLV